MRCKTWKVGGEGSLCQDLHWKSGNQNTDLKGKIITLKNEEMDKYQFVKAGFNEKGNKIATIDQRGTIYEFDMLHKKLSHIQNSVLRHL